MPAALMRGHDRERKGKRIRRIMRLEVAGKEWAARGEGSSGETTPTTEPRAPSRLAAHVVRTSEAVGCGPGCESLSIRCRGARRGPAALLSPLSAFWFQKSARRVVLQV